MLRRSRRAKDEDGNAVVVLETSNSQIVQTSDGPVEYHSAPHMHGPEGEQLVPDGPNSYRSPLGKLYTLVD